MAEFRYSRKATLGCLIGSTVLLALSVVAFDHPVGKVMAPAWLPALFFVATANFAWLMIRPRRLALDKEGFTITGGLGWRPTRFRWQEVGEFYVYRMARGTEAIGFKLTQPPRDHARFADNPSEPPGARSLPQGWDQSPASMVQELNSYRAGAVGGPASVGKQS